MFFKPKLTKVIQGNSLLKVLCLGSWISLLACGNGSNSSLDEDDTRAEDTSPARQHNDEANHEHMSLECPEGVTIETFESALTWASEGMQIQLHSSIQPLDVGEVTFTIEISTPNDLNATLSNVMMIPDMPLHGHGTSPASFVSPINSEGQAEIGPIDLFMPGCWHLELLGLKNGEEVFIKEFYAKLEG